MATFKVDTSRLGIEVGDFKADVGVETLREALTVVADGANAMKLAFLAGVSGATAATVAVGRYIMKTWPWMKPSLQNDKTLQLSCPSDKAEEFEELTKAGGELLSLAKPVELLKKDLKNMGVDDDTKNKIDKLTQQLKDNKLMSVERLKTTSGDVIGDDIVGGKAHFTYKDSRKIVKADPKTTGNVTGRRIGEGADVTEFNERVDILIGFGGDKEPHNKKPANQIKVSTRFSDGTKKLDEMFSPDDRVDDIVAAIIRQRNKKITKIGYYGTKEEIAFTTAVSALKKSELLLVELIALEIEQK